MALHFDGSADRLTVATPLSIGEDGHPMSFVCRMNRDVISGHDYAYSLADTGASNYQGLRLRSNNWTEAVDWNGSNFASARNTVGHVAGTWHFIAAVVGAANDRNVWLDSSKSSSTSDQAPSGRDTLIIGARHSGSGYTEYFDGKLAEVAFWSRALSDEEIASIRAGYSPLFFPDGLIAYLPMIRDTQDVMGNAWSVNGSPAASEHPTGIIYPAPPLIPVSSAAAPPVTGAIRRRMLSIGVGR